MTLQNLKMIEAIVRFVHLGIQYENSLSSAYIVNHMYNI